MESSQSEPPSRDSKPSTAPTSTTASPNHSRSSTTSFFTFPVSYAVSGLVRRFSNLEASVAASLADPSDSQTSDSRAHNMEGVYTPSVKRVSPFQPPPLTPLSISGYRSSTPDSAKLLNKALGEEIRLLIPARLQLVETWKLIYCLEEDGVSLATVYAICDEYKSKRGGYVLVVRDAAGGTFGAYLSDPPHPGPHYYGTGESFLWRAHTLPSLPTLIDLPPPPSADTTNAQRMTTAGQLKPPTSGAARSGASTPERIRFKAFPYSGINDYMIYCEQGYLSVGGGDGKYGLWLDDNLEKGVTSPCPTFGNEPLSDEGERFDIMGVEVWWIGT